MDHIKSEFIQACAKRMQAIENRVNELGPQAAMKDEGIRAATGFQYKKGSNKATFNAVITSQTYNFAKEMLEDMKDHDEIELTINSPGGSAVTGVALFNLLNSAEQRIKAIASGQAYSAAGVMMQGADERLVAPGSHVGVHRSWCHACGNEADFLRLTADLRKSDENILEIFSSVAKPTKMAQIKKYMDRDTALSGKEAVEVGLADRVLTRKEAKTITKTKTKKAEAKNEKEEQALSIEEGVEKDLQEISSASTADEMDKSLAKLEEQNQKLQEAIERLASEKVSKQVIEVEANTDEFEKTIDDNLDKIRKAVAESQEEAKKIVEIGKEEEKKAEKEEVKAEAGNPFRLAVPLNM